jgi:glycosyltransferase involved in cell wall biosynthesis
MNFSLKLLGLLLFCGSICILLGSPFLFDVAFRGKFAGGKDVMPWTLTYCSWFGLVTMAQLYLWCAERARLSCLALLLGLITNVALNCILLPLFGLKGAVWATAAANFTALAMIFRFNAWLGMKIERSMLLVALLPLSLGLGPVAALLTLAATICGIAFTNQILSADEKHQLNGVWRMYTAKLPWKRSNIESLQLAADGIHLPLPRGEGRGEGAAQTKTSKLTKVLATNQIAAEYLKVEPRPLRVMFIITSMHIGGAETLLFNLLKRIDRTRFTPELCCTKELGELGQQLSHEIPVYEHLLKHKFDLRVFGKLTRLLRRRQIDAVVTVGAGDKMFWGRLAAPRAKVPVIISALHSTGWPDGINWLNRRLTPLNDAFVAVARRHAEHLTNVEHLPGRRVYIIPNGVDASRYSPRPASAELLRSLGISTSAPLAGIVAVLRPEKNHEMFLRVAARVRRDVPEAQFLIIGDGPRRAELELLTSQLGIADCVHFLGNRADVPELLNLLDVFLLTSHNEANPVSILEAQACGKPVVATQVGSIAESVREGSSGYLVDPGDELQMAHHVTSLLLDPAKAEHLGNAGRQNVIENWSIDRMVAGYETLIETIYRRKTGEVGQVLADRAESFATETDNR